MLKLHSSMFILMNFLHFDVNPSLHENFGDLIRFITKFLLVRDEFLEIINEGRFMLVVP